MASDRPMPAGRGRAGAQGVGHQVLEHAEEQDGHAHSSDERQACRPSGLPFYREHALVIQPQRGRVKACANADLHYSGGVPANPSDIRAVALLDEPVRRQLYEIVAASRDPVSRDDAAAAAGISRALAAFHLDRLVDGGLLAAEYRRLSGRAGPGAGRPAKLYRRSAGDLAVCLPERHYELPARIFAEALEHETGPVPPTSVAAAASAGSAP